MASPFVIQGYLRATQVRGNICDPAHQTIGSQLMADR